MRETEVTPWSAIKLNGFQALFDIFRSILRNFGHRMHAGRRVSGLGPYSKALRFGLGFCCLPPARTDGVWTCFAAFRRQFKFLVWSRFGPSQIAADRCRLQSQAIRQPGRLGVSGRGGSRLQRLSRRHRDCFSRTVWFVRACWQLWEGAVRHVATFGSYASANFFGGNGSAPDLTRDRVRGSACTRG